MVGVKVPGSLEGERRQCRRQGWTARVPPLECVCVCVCVCVRACVRACVRGGNAGGGVWCGSAPWQDRHEAGVAGCPDGLAAAALSPVFFASLALEALAVVTCVVTLAEKPTLFSAGQLHRPLPQHRRAWQNGAVSPSRWASSHPNSERGRQ